MSTQKFSDDERPLVRLRSIDVCDLDHLSDWWSQAEASILDGGEPDSPDEVFREELEGRIRAGIEKNWFVVDLDENGPVGYVLYRINNSDPDSVEVAMRLSEAFWGQGIGKRSMELLLEGLLEVEGYLQAWLTVYIFNERGVRLYRSLGFDETESITDEKGLELIKMVLTRYSWLKSKNMRACG